MTTITAIVPTYNRAGYLSEALRAIMAQTLPVSEIIVWDDGSTDGTREAVAALAGETSALRYFRAENAGKSRALNRSIAEASGEAIWICDDDDICRPDAAAKMVATMAATGAPVVGGRYRRFGTDPATSAAVAADPGYWPDLSQGGMLRHILEDIFIFQNATLATRAAYDRVGPFREDLARSIDYDMIVRLAARHPVAFVDDVLFEQRKHDGARGPAAARHEAARMDTVWREADQKVFLDLWHRLPLSLYEAMFDAADQRLTARAARLQRATVYARRDLWDKAVAEFEAAAVLDAPNGMTALEHDICVRAMAGKHGCSGAMAAAITARLKDLSRRSPAGAAIASGLSRGLRWRCREAAAGRDFAMAARLTALMFSLGWRSLSKEKPARDNLVERASLPPEAYRW